LKRRRRRKPLRDALDERWVELDSLNVRTRRRVQNHTSVAGFANWNLKSETIG
jgi:hypothetical protein